jgi:hypothetical protein
MAPARPGRLTIKSESGGVLALGSESGAEFLFDLRTRLFIDPSTGVAYPPAPTPTSPPSPYHPAPVASVRIDARPGTNGENALGPTEECAAAQNGEVVVDVIVDSIPAYDPVTRTGGIAGFSFVLEFMSDFVSVTAVNPGGDSDTILAADGPMSDFTAIDADASDSDRDSLPATGGSIQVDIADLGRTIEDGAGVLARLKLVPASDAEVAWSDLRLRDVHLVEGSQTGREYRIESIGSAQVTFGGACP